MGDATPGQPPDGEEVADAQDNAEQEPEPQEQSDPVQPDEPKEGVAEPEEHFHSQSDASRSTTAPQPAERPRGSSSIAPHTLRLGSCDGA